MRLCRNQVSYPRRPVEMKAVDDILQFTVGVADTFMLTQMLEPGVEQEHFDQATFLRHVLEYAPVERAGAASLVGQLGKGSQKSSPIGEANSIFDRYHDGTPVGIDFARNNWIRPMHRRREIERGRRLQLPAHQDWHAERRSGGGNHARDRYPGERGRLAPDGTAGRHRAEHDGHVYRQAPPTNPRRQSHLC